MTDAERLLWSLLRRRFQGLRFHRQSPFGPFIVDFVCWSAKLVIEVDGGQHLESAADASRDRWMAEKGFRVLRFWNHEVLCNVGGVLERIAEEVATAWEDG